MFEDYDDLDDCDVYVPPCPECGEEEEVEFSRGVWRCYQCEHKWKEDEEEYDEEAARHLIDGVGFADPGGRSALRAETRGNPRNLPCPTCGSPNRLTPADRAQGYQCDACADAAEGYGP